MQVSLESEIRDRLRRYLVGEVPLSAFSEWLAPVLWNIEEGGDANAVELAYEIELRLAEYSQGHWTEQELRDILLPLVGPLKV